MKRTFLTGLIALFSFAVMAAPSAFDQQMLRAGTPFFATLNAAYDDAWPDAPMRSALAAQIEKESRWNPRAELCVPKPDCTREHGYGLTQFTVTAKFNVFNEIAPLHPKLKGWARADYMNPDKQLLGIVVKMKGHYRQCIPNFQGKTEIVACAASSYNGGFGGVLADRRLCANTKGCNPYVWFGNVAEYSTKAKQPLPGYGQSFYMINRGYARGVVYDWSPKYVPFFGS
jgi:membrane-bound lytic murein transglycosylase MltF